MTIQTLIQKKSMPAGSKHQSIEILEGVAYVHHSWNGLRSIGWKHQNTRTPTQAEYALYSEAIEALRSDKHYIDGLTFATYLKEAGDGSKHLVEAG